VSQEFLESKLTYSRLETGVRLHAKTKSFFEFATTPKIAPDDMEPPLQWVPKVES